MKRKYFRNRGEKMRNWLKRRRSRENMEYDF
jgi:hypothetical protein